MKKMQIRPLAANEVDEWLRMRMALWPDAEREDLSADVPQYLDAPKTGRPVVAAFVVPREDGAGLFGFIELSLRNIADGCSTSPVGYIEGWYVDAAARKRGIGRALVQAGEQWAREPGSTTATVKTRTPRWAMKRSTA